MGIKFGKLFGKPVEEDVVPEDVVPEDVVPEDVVPEDVVPEDVVPEDVVPEDVVPEDVVPVDVVPEDVVPEDVVPEDVVPEDVVPEDVVPEDVVPEDVVPEDVVPVDVVPEDVVPEDVVPEDVVPEDVVPEDVVPEDVVPEDVVPEDVVPEDVVPEDVVSEAGKRKSTDDGENLQDLKRTRLDDELPSSSGDTESRNTPLAALSQRSAKRKAVAAADGPVQAKKRSLDPSAMFAAKYRQQKHLGKGGYGSVFAGYRKADNLPVAIKRIPKNEKLLKHKDDEGKEIPMEVAVMLKLAADPERHSAPIDLLDWYDLGQELILVLERPLPAVDLLHYLTGKGGRVKEKEAKIITRQLLDAAIDLQRKQIFHRDIKVENLLIETCLDGIRVRVIDFGGSCFAEEGATYEDFYGTHVLPEWLDQKGYRAGPSTVFQMGVVLYDMLHADSFKWELSYLGKQKTNGRLSKDCRAFLEGCFHQDPDQRFTLEQLRDHLWMS